MLIANLAGIFTCSGFSEKSGRHPEKQNAGFISGPIHILCDQNSGRIIEIARGRMPSDPFNGEFIDADGLIATPGFIDSHTHALFAGDRSREFFDRWSGKDYIQIAAEGGGIRRTAESTSACSDEELRLTLEKRSHEMLASGTTTVEIKTGYGLSPADELRYLRMLKQINPIPSLPQVIPTFLGLHWIPPGWDRDSYTEAIKAIIHAVSAEGLAEFVDVFPDKGFFTLKNAIEFADCARQYGLKLKIHADEFTPYNVSETFIERRAISIDHCQHISPEAVHKLSQSGTVATLLPATSFFLNSKYADARLLIDSGARVALATDYNPGTAPCYRMQFTMLLAASQLKMNPYEILCAVTYNAAASLGIDNSIGTLTRNKMADILCWQVSGKTDSDGKHVLEEIIVSQQSPSLVIIRTTTY